MSHTNPNCRQAETLKRKRQKRDNLLKEQAQKRKRTEKPKAQEPELDQDEDALEVEKSTTSTRKRADKFSLPSELPAEFLTDSENESEDERALKMAQKPKKIKFDDAVQILKKEGLTPRDELVGTTAYRVVADYNNQKLAPKANHNSKNVKEMLLHRRRVGVPATKGKGFFRRK
jgi:U3 small nucleolar RNA-associated protein 16